MSLLPTAGPLEASRRWHRDQVRGPLEDSGADESREATWRRQEVGGHEWPQRG